MESFYDFRNIRRALMVRSIVYCLLHSWYAFVHNVHGMSIVRAWRQSVVYHDLSSALSLPLSP